MLEHLRDRGDDIRRVREEKFHDDERGGAAGTLDHRDEFQVVHGVDLTERNTVESANVLDAPCRLLPHLVDAGDELLLDHLDRVVRVARFRPPDIDDDTQALHPITGPLNGNRGVTDQLES